MSTEEQAQVEEKPQVESQDAQMQDETAPPTGPAAMSTGNKKRPRLDLAVDSRERKRGKTMFGIVLGTLNRAKNEDKARSASEAAKKRQMIEQRLQDKLRKETDSVRRAEEAKKDKTVANRKEEELQLKDSIHKLRRTRLPLLANFLSTADKITNDDDSPSAPDSTVDPLAPPPRSHPPPIYYLPAILTPAQETFLQKRKAQVTEAAEKEWEAFKTERSTGIEEISRLRQRVAEEEERKKTEKRDTTAEEDVHMGSGESEESKEPESQSAPAADGEKPADAPSMDVDDDAKKENKEDAVPPPTVADVSTAAAAADEEDAVEY